MKHILKTILIITVVFFFSCIKLLSQNSEQNHDIYYWFSVELYDYEWEEGIMLLNIHSEIKKGSVKEFKRSIRKKLRKSILPIGPFMSEADADFAVNVYKRIYSENKKTHTNEKYIFFPITLIEKGNSGSYKITDVGTNVNIGDIKAFKKLFQKGITKSHILIGPFKPGTDFQNEVLLNLY